MNTHQINTCEKDTTIKLQGCRALKNKYSKEIEDKSLYVLGMALGTLDDSTHDSDRHTFEDDKEEFCLDTQSDMSDDADESMADHREEYSLSLEAEH